MVLFEWCSLIFSIVPPKLTCHRLRMNHAINNLTCLFHLSNDYSLCLQSVRLLNVPHRPSKHGDDGHHNDVSKHNVNGAPQSQISAIHMSPHPHCFCPHNVLSITTNHRSLYVPTPTLFVSPQLPPKHVNTQLQTVHGYIDRNSSRCRCRR